MDIDLVKEYWYIFTIGWLFIGAITVTVLVLLDRSSNFNEGKVTRGDAIILSTFGPLLLLAVVWWVTAQLSSLYKNSEFLNKPFLK